MTGASRATAYNWMDKGNIPLNKLPALALAGVDVQYVLTGVRAQDFESKLRELSEVTRRVMELAEAATPRPDPIRLGAVRDIAYQGRLTDMQITILLNLLRQAREPDFWLDKS